MRVHMAVEKIYTSDEEIRNKLKWLMGLRVVIVTVLMSASIALKADQGGASPIFYFLIAFTYFLTILYSVVLKRIRALTFFTYFQIGVDLALETSLVMATGGLASPLTFLYMISIITASMVLYRQGGMAAALASSLMFGMAGILPQDAWVDSGISLVAPREALYTLLINVVAFFTVAALSSSLAEKLKQARETLQEKETGLTEFKAFHENIVQSMSSGLLTADLEGRITSFNRAAEEITGLSSEEVRGKRCMDVLGWGGLQQYCERSGEINRSRRFDVETKRKDGAPLLLGVTLSPLRDELSRVTGVVGTFQDLTKIRKLEEEMKKREKLASIGELAAGMAHEIRNPLAALSGSMQVLHKELDLSEEHTHLMDIALKETDRLNKIITEFLYYARPSPLNFKSCDLNQLLEETLQLLKRSSEYHEGIQFVTDFCKVPVLARVDSDQMKQVFWNLSINAVQAMPDSGFLKVSTRIREEISLGISDPSQEAVSYIEVIFEDEGEGILREHLPRIFDPFFTTKPRGSGLGLAIVHRIMEEHRGRIWAESLGKRGARFTLLLPAEQNPR